MGDFITGEKVVQGTPGDETRCGEKKVLEKPEVQREHFRVRPEISEIQRERNQRILE